MEEHDALIVFEGKNIRRTWFNDEWHYSVVDVIEVLTESPNPRRYWSDLKIKLEEDGVELYGLIVQLKLPSTDRKFYTTDCANTEALFRIIQSIPSKKAEPFKRWLAQVGYQRIQEIENPELAQDRVKEYYELKGYSKEWIEKRMRGIAIRQELTNEWTERGAQHQKDFAILTNEISKATFGKTVGEYKQFKRLTKSNQNLRDHMTDWELILNMIGEKATADITIAKDVQGIPSLQQTAKEGGTIARNTRKELERKTGKPLVSKENYLHINEKKKEEINEK